MFRLYAIAVVTVAVVVACDTVPLTSPTGSTISITADRNVVPLNGQAELRAVVIESGGTPVHNGTVVMFTTSLGTVVPAEAKTVNGVANAIFSAGGISGTTTIHAYSGGARTGSGNSSGGGVELKIGAAAAAGVISMSATPPSVSQSGGTVTISAIVFDAANNPLPGVAVLFTSSAGALSATQAISDATGIARTTLTTTQTTTVNAIAGPAKGEVQVVVSAPPSVTIDTGAGPFSVGTPVPITIKPGTAGSGNASPRQIATIVVDFGDGTQQRLTNVTGDVGLTHTYGREGGYTITATASDVSGNTSISSKAIVVGRQQLPTVTLSTGPTTTVAVPIAVDFGATAPAPAQIISARVTLQDGTVIYSGTNANDFNYKFSAPGTYTLTGTVTDSNGNTATASTTVFVS